MADIAGIEITGVALYPNARKWDLQRDVRFVDMRTGEAFFNILAGAQLETTYRAAVNGVEYAVTGFSAKREKLHGFRLADLEAALTRPTGETTVADDQTAADEKKLFDELLAMLAGGKDGVEAGFTTTEFYLTVLAVGIDVAGPYLGILQGISGQEQLGIATILVMGYGALRSWRKRGGPAKLLAELVLLLAKARGTAPVAPPAPVPPVPAAADVPQAA